MSKTKKSLLVVLCHINIGVIIINITIFLIYLSNAMTATPLSVMTRRTMPTVVRTEVEMYSWDIMVKVNRTFARGLEASTCPLNMKKANMFPISPDTWSTSQFIHEPCFQDTAIIHSWCSWNTFWKQAKPGASPKQCRSSCLLSQGRCIWPRNFPVSFKLCSFATF